jgi:hypothetical protein
MSYFCPKEKNEDLKAYLQGGSYIRLSGILGISGGQEKQNTGTGSLWSFQDKLSVLAAEGGQK